LTTLNATIVNLRRRSLFIGSSSEAVQRGVVAQMVDKLSDVFEVRPWQQHFTGGRFTLEVLISEARQADAAILIFTKDDPREFRGELDIVARDNVILEYGLFMGLKGRDRVLIIEEEGVNLPSDVLGVTTLKFRADKGAAVLEADFHLIAQKISKQWSDLMPSVPEGEIQDAGLGVAGTLKGQLDTLTNLIRGLNTYASDRLAFRPEPLLFDSPGACVSTSSEALDLVQRRFWTTTFLSSGFWSQLQSTALEANTNMMRRLKETGGEARRLFLLDQEPGKAAQSYRAHRIHSRRLGRHHELRRLDVEFANLRRNVRRLIEGGCDVRVAFDGKESFKSLPDGMLTDSDESSVAIYDSFRVDVQDTVGRGVVARAKVYCPATHNFETYLRSAEQYFEDLWETAQPAASFLDELQQALDSAQARIDYESNWLAIYEFALDRDDEDLKTVEIKRAEEVLRSRGLWGSIDRYLDIGTCTGSYPIHLREAVRPEGEILGVDEDFDCVRFARSNVRRHCPEDRRIRIQQLDFTGRETRLDPGFDLITCMLGTIAHFGWDRQPSFNDTLQRALTRMKTLLRPDGLLIIGTWSRYACDTTKMISIYSESDRQRLAEWTSPIEELKQRLALADLQVTDRLEPELRLDFLVCARAGRTDDHVHASGEEARTPSLSPPAWTAP
jgi:SAM-dependent methyltransferase